ncbi:FecCD family ABC transporter permease [Gryllotalpicola ginsengisoli]|uniref:FecCD family ABC transporter permease n=1 Tax=Gryllotalpicola ginsengisoli TaxID=444608 RepID=UPI0003B67E46|nr:iron chelate uptake ABC transporter family permease subunit [Gryllotalpicola ginsengisoli]
MTVLSHGPARSRVIRLAQWSLVVRPRAAAVCSALFLALLAAIVAALSVSVNFVPVGGVLAALTGHGTPAEQLIVVQLRLPRAAVGALVGLALGLAGALFQSVTRNPLGSPDVIGFDTGAATGALIAMLFTAGGAAATSLGAVLGGAGTAAVVFLLSLRHRGLAPLRLVLVGIGAGALLAALNSLLIVNAQVYDAQSAAVWLVGNLAGSDWTKLAMLAPVVVVGAVLALLLERSLAVGEFADERALSLGLSTERLRLAAMAVGVLLASAAVAAAGPISFVALAAPQLARRLTRASGPNLLASALTGAVLLVLTDLAAREAFQPRQLPVGVLTGVVGGLYLVWLLGREWKKGRA